MVNPTQPARMPRFPDELLMMMFSYLGPDDLISVGQVSSQWRSVARDESMWQYQALDDTISDDKTIARMLLAAPCLDKLNIWRMTETKPDENEHLKTVILTTTCRVRALGVKFNYDGTGDAAWAEALMKSLAPSVRELFVDNITLPAMKSIDFMPNLVGLRVRGCNEKVLSKPYIFRSREKEECTVQRLYIDPFLPFLSLLSAHRHSLRRVTVWSYSPPPKDCDPLKDLAKEGGFSALKSLELAHYCFTSDSSNYRCLVQITDLRLLLPRVAITCRHKSKR